tara:strand:+ start:240 stop:497 length:258 start_codon:yes stop_codon:yes gene_type:complete
LQSRDIEEKREFIAKILSLCASCYEVNLESGATVKEEAEYIVNLIGSLFVYAIEHRGIDPKIIDNIILVLTQVAKERYEEEIPVM